MSRSEKLRQLLDQDPDDVFLNFGLAMELAKEGRIDSALERFDRVLELDPAYLTAHSQKALVLIDLERFDEARAALEAGIEAARTAGDAHAESAMQTVLKSLRR